MEGIEKTTLGSSSLRLTRLGFGGAPIGNTRNEVSDADARSALEAAWDAGIRYFDTSPWYGLGLSEHRVGAFLRGKPREDYIISTKVGRLLKPWPKRYGARRHRGAWLSPPDFEVRFDYSYDGIIRAYEDSLQRLGLPEVDALFVHDLDRSYHVSRFEYEARMSQLVNGGIDALRDLRAEAKVQAIGVGVNRAGVITDMLEIFQPDMFLVAGPYTLLNQEILQTELERCREANIGVIIGAAFGYGLLATSVRNLEPTWKARVDPATLERAARIEEICERHQVDLPAAAIQFPGAHRAVASTLFGAIDADQVREAISWAKRRIPPALWHELIEEGLVSPHAPLPG